MKDGTGTAFIAVCQACISNQYAPVQLSSCMCSSLFCSPWNLIEVANSLNDQISRVILKTPKLTDWRNLGYSHHNCDTMPFPALFRNLVKTLRNLVELCDLIYHLSGLVRSRLDAFETSLVLRGQLFAYRLYCVQIIFSLVWIPCACVCLPDLGDEMHVPTKFRVRFVQNSRSFDTLTKWNRMWYKTTSYGIWKSYFHKIRSAN